MEDLLTSTYSDGSKVQGVLSPYDGLSRGIITALQNAGYGPTDADGLPIVTGQDAEIASVKLINDGVQFSTIFKDTRKLAEQAVVAAQAFLAGEEPEANDTETYDNGVKVVPSYLLDVGHRLQGQHPVAPDRLGLLDRGRRSPAARPDPYRPDLQPAGTRTVPAGRAARPARGADCGTLHDEGRWKPHGQPHPRDARHHQDVPRRQGAAGRLDVASERGEIHAICGENGAGKSTLMKVLSGVYPHGTYDGEILFEGDEVAVRVDQRLRGQGHRDHPPGARAGALPVDRGEHLPRQRALAPRASSTGTVANSEAAALLARVGLDETPVTPVGQLGVGKQQLVEIAKALSKEVKLLILDEPTAALNDNDSEHLLGLLRQLKAQGITSIMISHKLNEIAEIADTTTIIRDGRTIETLDMVADEVTQERIIRGHGRPRPRAPVPRPHESHIGEEVLRIEDWTVHHPTDPDRVVVDGANLTVRAGEIVGIAGLMGAGRTELAMCVFGRSYGSNITGKVFLHGKEIRVAHGRPRRSTTASPTPPRTARSTASTSSRTSARTSPPRTWRRCRARGWVNGNEEIKVAEEFRQSMNIKAPTVLALAGKLSGGNQQKVVLSKWLYTDPQVLILDEPTRGIDVGAKYEIYTLINRLAEEGKAVARHLLRAARAARHLRPHLHALGRPDHRRARREEQATQENLMELMTKERDQVR